MKGMAISLLAAMLLLSTGCRGADHDFDGVVQGLEQHYSARVQRVPMMAFLSFCARIGSGGGVRDLHIAEIDRVEHADAAEVAALVRMKLGSEWQPFVRSRERAEGGREGDSSFIFVRPDGRSMRVLIADYSGNEINVVRMELDGAALGRWMKQHEGSGSSAASVHHPSRQTD